MYGVCGYGGVDKIINKDIIENNLYFILQQHDTTWVSVWRTCTNIPKNVCKRENSRKFNIIRNRRRIKKYYQDKIEFYAKDLGKVRAYFKLLYTSMTGDIYSYMFPPKKEDDLF